MQRAAKEIGQIRKSQAATRILVKMLLDAGTSKFKAKLHVVLVHLPGKVVEEMIVGVHSAAWIARRGARLRVKAAAAARCYRDQYDWQPRSVACRRVVAVAHSDAVRVEFGILGEKSFSETVPAKPCFVYFGCAKRIDPRKRDKLHARRRDGVEPGQLTAGSGQRQRK